MNCSNCGAPNRPGRKFCAQCGTSLAVGCPACGASNDPGDRFCGECGTTLQEVSASAVGVGSDAASERTGARTATSNNPAPVAERRLVSVLFADLVGFTPFSEERDAEDVRAVLSRYFEIATEVVERYGGTIEKFIGDAVMAVWGTPTAHEDDAERAVRAALDLVDEVHSLGPAISARAGVVTGETAVTLAARNEGMVAGDIVNTAARLQAAAPEGTVLVGEATYRAASTSIAFDPAGEQTLKGKSSPVAAWHALRVLAGRGGLGRSTQLEPPFVGRDEELRLLKDALQSTGREQRARLVSITGPGGIGKSRLAWELEKYVDGVVETVYWHRGRCPAYGDGITFWALGEMIRRRAKLAESDDEATTRERIAQTVAEWIPDPGDRAWVEPALLTLLGVETSPVPGRDVLFAAWRILFERIAARGTTVLLFEDLQWADSGLLEFIDYLLEWSKSVPLLVITLARPELYDRRPDWGTATRSLVSLALGPLSDGAMHELLAGFAPGLPANAVDAILAKAEGVPLYAVEMVRSLVADGRLELVEGAYRPIGELGTITIPDTLRSLIASRLDALDAGDRSLVQDASVLGQVFTLRGLAAVSGRPEADVEARLRTLIRRELFELEADPRSPERGQYRFVQELIRDVAHGTLARPERRARHLAAARFFEMLGEDELAGALATHYLAAHAASTSGAEAEAVAIQARLALRGAAQRAAQLGAHAQAVTYLRQALEIASDPADRAALLVEAATSADAAGDPSGAERSVREAIDAYRELGDRSATGSAEALLGRVLINGGQIVEAIASIERALLELPETDDPVRAELLTHLSRALFRNEQTQRSVEIADAALAISERLNLEPLVAEALNNKGAAIGYQGRRRESEALHEVAVRIARANGQVSSQARAMNNLASALSETDLRRSLEIIREARIFAERVGSRAMADMLLGSEALTEFDLGDDWAATTAELDEAIREATTPYARGRFLLHRIVFASIRGEPGLDEDLERAAAIVAAISDIGFTSGLELARGWVSLTTGDPTAAFRHFTAAADAMPSSSVVVLPPAFHAAIWVRDTERLRQAIDRYGKQPYNGPVAATESAGARAGLAALEGRTAEAIEGYRQVLRRWAELRVYFSRALAALDFVIAVGRGEPEARAAADDAREVFQRLGARPLLARLDEAMAAAPPAPKPTAPKPPRSVEAEERASEAAPS